MNSVLSYGNPNTTIVVIPVSTSGSLSAVSLPNSLIDEIIGNAQFEDRIKTMVEGTLANLTQNLRNNIPETLDNPFDSIYLAELKPDKLDPTDFMVLNEFQDVVDLSDSIIFDDEWGD